MTRHSKRSLKEIFTIKTTEGRLKLFILIIGIIGFSSLFMFSSLKITMQPFFCSLCHEMKPEYATWKASVHSDFSCTECHIEPGVNNLVKDKIGALNQVYKHFTGTYVTPIEINKDISNKTCLQCHSDNRPVTPPEGLVFPHQRHVKQGFNCVLCHNNVAHGGIEERGFTINTDYSKWTTGMGKAYMKQNFTMLDMQTCIDCHTDKGVSTSCVTCHTGSVNLPETHLKDNWKKGQHGIDALKNIKQCDKCHSYANSYLVKPGPNEVAEYARNNEFCSKCHMTKPPGHTENWRQIHGPQAKVQKDGCLVCHDENRPGKAEDQVSKVYCVKCHAQQQHGNILNNHPPFSLQGKTLQKSCLSCHPSNICGSCHYIK